MQLKDDDQFLNIEIFLPLKEMVIELTNGLNEKSVHRQKIIARLDQVFDFHAIEKSIYLEDSAYYHAAMIGMSVVTTRLLEHCFAIWSENTDLIKKIITEIYTLHDFMKESCNH